MLAAHKKQYLQIFAVWPFRAPLIFLNYYSWILFPIFLFLCSLFSVKQVLNKSKYLLDYGTIYLKRSGKLLYSDITCWFNKVKTMLSEFDRLVFGQLYLSLFIWVIFRCSRRVVVWLMSFIISEVTDRVSFVLSNYSYWFNVSSISKSTAFITI